MTVTMRTKGAIALLAAGTMLLASTPLFADEAFTWHTPGDVEGASGRVDHTVYVPGMRFPIENAPAFANSQVHGHGGYLGPGGGQCDTNNYSYPWRDNYCESRSWSLPLCPSGTGHQGQDIRPATCKKGVHPAVAAQDGTITSIGTYSVYLTADDGTRHRYLHLDMARLAVSSGQRVTRGQRLGYVSNDFGGTATTIHLHYDIHQHVSGIGKTYVPTYMSLVRSYEALLGTSGTGSAPGCAVLGPQGGVLDNTGPCFRLFGPSTTWRHVTSAGHGGSLYWSKAWNGATAANWAEWQLGVETAGRYRVETYIEPGYATSRQSRWGVRASEQEHEVRLDLSQASGWTSLGTFELAAGATAQWVRVYDNTGEASSEDRRFPADAVRLVPVDATPAPTTPVAEPQLLSGCAVPHAGGILDSAGGCVALHGPSKYWRHVSDAGLGGSLYWTKAYAGSAPSNWAQFRFTVDEAGVYELGFHNEPSFGTSQRARFALDIAGQRHDVRLSLAGESGWVRLGTFTMRPGTQQQVALYDNTGEASALGRRLPVDALQLRRVSDDTGGSVVILPAGNGTGGGLVAEPGTLAEAPESKQFMADAPGAELDDDAPLADGSELGQMADPGCACSVRASSQGSGAPLGVGLALVMVGLVWRRRRA